MKNKLRKLRKGPVAVAAIIVVVLMMLLMRACSYVSALDTPVNNTDVSVTNPSETTTNAPTQPTEPATEPSEPATEPTEHQVEAHVHSYQAIVVAPTCTTQGYTEYTCECGDRYTNEETDVLEHSWAQWAVEKEPTTEEEGMRQRECQNCEATEATTIEKVVEAHTHSYEAEEIKPTCTEDGYVLYTCKCGYAYVGETIPTTGHQYTANVVAPTCEAQGYTIHLCSVCDDRYADSYVSANGHNYNNGKMTTEPTCTEKGVKTFTCYDCKDTYTEKVAANGHSYESVVTKPDCINGGYTTHTCSICGNTYNNGEVDAIGHSYEGVVTAPTCVDKGFTTYTCVVCGGSYVADEVKALGHSFTKYISNDDATCAKDGTETAKCDNGCGKTNTATDKGSSLGHSYDAVVTKPTCTKDGYTTYTCSVCKDTYTDNKVEKLGHKWDDANCIKAKTCSVCKATEGKAAGHDYESVVTKPTCTEGGYTTHKCSACGDKYTDSKVSATGHIYGEWQVVNKPTCYSSGTECRDCINCDAYEAREVAAKAHVYEAVVTDPTCTEKGFTTYTCADCGAKYVGDRVKATGHDMGSWNTTKKATCTNDGKEVRDCANCNYSETREIVATGHSHKAAETVAVTCTTDGYTTYKCSCGDSYFADVVPATGHNYNSEVVEPTTSSEGYTVHTCANCGDSYKDNYVDVLPPVEEEPEEDDSGCCGYGGCCGHHDAHEHIEVKIGKYTYVYCIHVTSIYKSADGLFIFYPYDLYS